MSLPTMSTDDILYMSRTLDSVIKKCSQQSEPFKTKAIYKRHFMESVRVEINGVEMKIHDRHCYFTPAHQSKGDEVFVDERYLIPITTNSK